MRIMNSFWLDQDKEDQAELLEIIERMKANRQFSRSIRDGLRLIESLQNGNTDVLYSLFPDIQRGNVPVRTEKKRVGQVAIHKVEVDNAINPAENLKKSLMGLGI